MGRLLLLSIFLVSLSIQAQETECPSVSETLQKFCEGEGATVADLRVEGTDVMWFASATSTEALASTQVLEKGNFYFAGYEGSTCEKPSVLVEVERQPIAGRTTRIYLCSDSGPVDLQKLISPIDDESNIFHGRSSDPGGYFRSHPFGQNSTVFDPAIHTWKSGAQLRYYTPLVDNAVCEQDMTFVYLFITEAPNAGDNGSAEFFSNGEGAELSNYLSEGTTPGGVWSYNSEVHSGSFDPSFDEPGIYTYTVEVNEILNGPGANEYYTQTCIDSSVLEVIVHNVDEKNLVCHKGKTLEVGQDAVQAHLDHGDTLGECSSSSSKTVVSPNPSHGEFIFSNDTATIQKVRILNFKGGVEKEFQANGDPKLLEINLGQLKKGIYFAEVFTTNGKEVLRLVKK